MRKSTSQKLYESVQQPPEISTLKKRMYENPEALVCRYIENFDLSHFRVKKKRFISISERAS